MKRRKNKLIVIIKKLIIIILVIFLFFIFLLFSANSINKSIPIFGYRFYVITSDSMNPNINSGDMIIVKKSKKYNIGDVITFKDINENITITHRIIEIEKGDRYVTKGDSNYSKDESQVETKNIIGKVVKKIPGVGIQIEIIKNFRFTIIIIIFLLVWYLLYSNKRDKSNIRKMKKETLKVQDEKKIDN